MARFRIGEAVVLSLLLGTAPARAAEDAPPVAPALYDRPVLVVDPGMHTAIIRRASADAAGRWVVTGSDDKTVRVWSLADGTLERTIRLPAGPGNIGKAYAVALSPDGALIAVGGWTRWTEADPQQQIYLFDRATGALVRPIEGLPNVVLHLAFSPDGQRLAATLGQGGMRIYGRAGNWTELARDDDYGNGSAGTDFSPDGRLVTTSLDGKVRLYAGDLAGTVLPTATASELAGHPPFGVAFSPDGARLAVGYYDGTAVDLLDGRTLARLPGPDLAGIDGGALSEVAWSQDAGTLFAAGQYHEADGHEAVLAWSGGGAGARRVRSAGQDTVSKLIPLPDGDLLVAAEDPWLARLPPDGTPRWVRGPPKADFRGQARNWSVSDDGTVVDFCFALFGKEPARFDLANRTLQLDPPVGGRTSAPRQDGLTVVDWDNTTHPTLNGKPLPLERYETSRSLAIDPSGDRFVLGADWSLRAFDARGKPLWTRPVPGAVWAVNISGDGRLVVATYDDGTIRWHRMSDGEELLAFMPLADRTNWVAWTPEGFYAASAGAHGTLRWHVNNGWEAADSVAVEDIPGSFRPEVLPLVLQELETPRALGLADMAEHNRQIAIRTHSHVPPGAQLHLLTIGISAYNEDYAKNLRLKYADRDAHDLASAIVNTQGSLYARVNPQVLENQNATRDKILYALDSMKKAMELGTGNDLAVVHFSGHGALIDGKLYLLPYDVDARLPVGIKSKALRIDELRDELILLAGHGRVLVLLDACHSGATTGDGAGLPMDSTALRTGLAAANVTVLTSSSGSEVSFESDAWQHGAFTKVLLDALSDAAVDTDHNGLINTTALAHFVKEHVLALTDSKQTPDMEVRFDTTLFASTH